MKDEIKVGVGGSESGGGGIFFFRVSTRKCRILEVIILVFIVKFINFSEEQDVWDEWIGSFGID